MKRLGMFLVLLSVSLFALGCQPAEEPKPDDKPVVEEGAGDAADMPAPEGDTEPAPEETPVP